MGLNPGRLAPQAKSLNIEIMMANLTTRKAFEEMFAFCCVPSQSFSTQFSPCQVSNIS